MNQEYNIYKIAKKLDIDEEAIIPYGLDKAKIDIDCLNKKERKGKLILCTAITPTKAGEGKTTTAIGLADGLAKLDKSVIACLREPSLGPVFGVKGGGAGALEATLYPEEDINLHFTGDIHAITSVNNLIAALIDNELYQKTMDIDPNRIIIPRAMDMNDRGLRDITTNQNDKKVVPHHSSFVITAASEVMAIFCLAKDEEDFLNRIEDMTVAYTRDGKDIRVKQLECREAIRKLIHNALKPNLVQSKYHTPSIVHGGPFANIAHGTNSIIATDLSLRLADYVVTEAGFGSDLGMEKYLDIVAPLASIRPNLIVMVASIRALKLHGGVKFEDLEKENLDAIKIGFANLKKHVSNVKLYHVSCLVGINRFSSDTQEEIKLLEDLLDKEGIPYELNSSSLIGPTGALSLASRAIKMIEDDKDEYRPLVDEKDDLFTKIDKICKNIYGADDVVYENGTREELKRYIDSGFGSYSICMSKVPNSLSDDSHLLNVPKHTIHIKALRLFTGARFIVPLTGEVFTMPGLPKVPASKRMNKI